MLEQLFKLNENKTTVRTEIVAGITTFLTMAYIVFVNPAILSNAGIPAGPSFVATVVAAVFGCALMGLYANRPFAIAPYMGENAFIAFTVCGQLGYRWQTALAAIFTAGVLFVLLTVFRLRQWVVEAVPLSLRYSFAVGIGLFLAFIGLYDSGLIVQGQGTPVTLAHWTTWPVFVTIVGLVLTLVLYARWRKGALLAGIIGTTVVAIIVNSATDHAAFGTTTATWPGWSHIASWGDWSLFGNFDFHAFGKLGVVSALVWVFALFLSDFFDTMGTLVGVGKPAGYLNDKGEMEDIRRPLLVDSLAAMAGGMSSTSSATTYIESGSGVAAGGRTGWVAVVCGALFLPFLFFAPIISMVPAQATAAALIIVGYLMVSQLTEAEGEAELEEGIPVRGRARFAGIDFHDLAIGLPAALVIMLMPFSYSITNGIGFGFITYVLIRATQGRTKDVHPLMWIASAAFALYFLVPLLQDHVSWI